MDNTKHTNHYRIYGNHVNVFGFHNISIVKWSLYSHIKKLYVEKHVDVCLLAVYAHVCGLFGPFCTLVQERSVHSAVDMVEAV